MLKKILIASDLSKASKLIIGCVSELKAIGMEEAILVHVTDYASFLGADDLLLKRNGEAYGKDMVNVERTFPVLAEQKKALEDAGINVQLKIAQGVPEKVIHELAEDHDVSAIVVGSHGKGILKKTVLGSVSSALVNSSKKPIILVRVTLDTKETMAIACGNMFRQVLFLTDFSDTANKAFSYLENIVTNTASSVHILHVKEKGTAAEQLRSVGVIDGEKQEKSKIDDLKEKKQRLVEAGAPNVTISMEEGKVIDTVLARIRQDQSSFVIMGSQGKGLAEKLLLGSVSLQVVKRVAIPVLLIPAD